MDLRRLSVADIGLIGEIDRSEEVPIGYEVVDGTLRSFEANWSIPAWDREGSSEHSVRNKIETWRPVVGRGAAFVGASEGDDLAGVLIVEPEFEPEMAWLAFLHVTRSFRRSGVGSLLWEEAVRLARAAGATSMYVSAAPSQSAVGFYMSRGCVLVETPHPDLFAEEPEDIHLICEL